MSKKKIVSRPFLAFIALFASLSETFADCALREDVPIDGPANCRASPKGKIVKSIPDREKVTVLKKNGNWFQVRTGSIACWTSKSNLRIYPADPLPAEQICGDGLSEEDNELIERASVPNPGLSEIIGADGKPLSDRAPTPKPRDKK